MLNAVLASLRVLAIPVPVPVAFLRSMVEMNQVVLILLMSLSIHSTGSLSNSETPVRCEQHNGRLLDLGTMMMGLDKGPEVSSVILLISKGSQ